MSTAPLSRRRADAARGADSFVLQIQVKPRARVSQLSRTAHGAWVAQLQSPPVDGRANAELIGLVAGHLGCAKAAVTIKSGASGRTKLVKVVGVRPPAGHEEA